MPKNIIIEKDINHQCQVSRLLNGRLNIHQDYGLWICSSVIDNGSLAYRTPKPRYYECYAVSQLIEEKGWFWTKEQGKKNFSAGEAVIVLPRVIQDYSGYGKYYREDSVCFAGPIADSLVQSGILQTGIYKVGKLRRLLPIIEQAANPARDSQIKANIALQQYLIDIYLENQQKKSLQKDEIIDKLIQKIIISPGRWWSVETMSEMCNLSKNHFTRVFKQKTGLTPKAYIDRLKMNSAIDLLSTTDKSIARIADSLGYKDQFHFSRRFKELKGLSPQVFRDNSYPEG